MPTWQELSRGDEPHRTTAVATLTSATSNHRVAATALVSLITKHLSSPDERKIVGHGTIYFQNGLLTLQHLDAKYNTAMRNTEVRKLESAWTALSILAEVGINEESIVSFLRVLHVLDRICMVMGWSRMTNTCVMVLCRTRRERYAITCNVGSVC